jgi:hypothetical protein
LRDAHRIIAAHKRIERVADTVTSSSVNSVTQPDEVEVGRAIALLCETAAHIAPGAVSALVRVVCKTVGATDGRLLVADYGLLRLQEVDTAGRVGDPQFIEGTLAGRAFANGEPVVSGSGPTLLWVPLTHGTERIGVLELVFDHRDGALPDVVKPVIDVFVLLLITQSRYSDLWCQARRSEPLSAAAEAQWDLLPPLACSTNEVALAGILEPAYEIGGDSFDYALNGNRLDFAIVDAVGHGMSSVLMSAAVINSARNTRREGGNLTTAYQQADQVMRDHFGDCYYVTGQLATLDLPTGSLRWINAGHPPPLLVRNGTYAGELACAPSMPIGLGGSVVEVATQKLQGGDRVLFYTDGITESRSADASRFGTERLADLLVRSTHDHVPVAETVRRLSANVVAYVDEGLNDDATLLLIEYRG